MEWRLICPRENWGDPQVVSERERGLLRFVAQRLNLVFREDADQRKVYLDQRRPMDSAPAPAPGQPGKVAALLTQAAAMVGLHERRDTAAIQAITGRSGINPATTPWCAAWAMSLLEMHGLLDLAGLSNRNYCPTVKAWAQETGRWQGRGYTPRPGDAILFTWTGDGVPEHIGLVERVEGGKVLTIEGNAGDMVSRRSYFLGDADIAGYVRVS